VRNCAVPHGQVSRLLTLPDSGAILANMDTTDNADNGAMRFDATAADVAKKYGVTARSVRRWCEMTEIPHRWTPGGPRFNLEQVDAWMMQKRAELAAART